MKDLAIKLFLLYFQNTHFEVQLPQHRHQKGGRLPRASLRTGHNVAPGVNDGHRPLLNRRRHRVMGQFDVFGDDWPQSTREEIVDWCRDILATC